MNDEVFPKVIEQSSKDKCNRCGANLLNSPYIIHVCPCDFPNGILKDRQNILRNDIS